MKKNVIEIDKKYFARMMLTVMLFGIAITVFIIFGSMYFFQNYGTSLLESSSLEIKGIVANVTDCCYNGNGCGNGAGEYCVAKSLYEWERDNINYTVQKGGLSADETLKIRSGDCADMSILYCSLARQAGIECYYIETGRHMFSYVILNRGESTESVYVVDIANQNFKLVYM